MTAANVIWHDLECGSYREDLPLWRALADEYGSPVLDVGAGTGRVALDLARAGHTVTALDTDAELLGELSARARDLPVNAVHGDARAFALGRSFSLCIVPMQTIQLLGGSAQRLAFLRCARLLLQPGGIVAIAIAEQLEYFELQDDGGPAPLPDLCERDGVLYCSQPTAVRLDGEQFVLERRREIVDARGQRSAALDLIRLDRVDSAALEREGLSAGLRSAGRRQVASTADYVGSEVVLLGV